MKTLIANIWDNTWTTNNGIILSIIFAVLCAIMSIPTAAGAKTLVATPAAVTQKACATTHHVVHTLAKHHHRHRHHGHRFHHKLRHHASRALAKLRAENAKLHGMIYGTKSPCGNVLTAGLLAQHITDGKTISSLGANRNAWRHNASYWRAIAANNAADAKSRTGWYIFWTGLAFLLALGAIAASTFDMLGLRKQRDRLTKCNAKLRAELAAKTAEAQFDAGEHGIPIAP